MARIILTLSELGVHHVPAPFLKAAMKQNILKISIYLVLGLLIIMGYLKINPVKYKPI